MPERLQLQSSADEYGLSTPSPRRFYINDDLSHDVRVHHGETSEAWRLTETLLALVRQDAGRIIVLTEEEQIEALVGRARHTPFVLTLAIGRAGQRVAGQLHARTGWFPAIRRLDITRQEDERGEHTLATGPAPLAAQLAGIDVPSLAIVDDTVFSGLTMRSVLLALSPSVRARTHAFCLRAVAETLPGLTSLAPVSAGIAAAGRILEDVSFINASGLVRRGAIRRTGQPSLAFFEREEWMRAWFPGYAEEVTQLCQRLNALLERA